MAKGSKLKKLPAGGTGPGAARKFIPAQAARPPRTLIVPSPGLFVVRWTRFDYGGPWCLRNSSTDVLVDLMIRIRNLESMSPRQIFCPNGVGIDYGDPSRLPNSDAYQRLHELQLNDETNLSRLQINGLQRLYGFRRDPEFYAIFWDPEHGIWPSKLRNT